MGNFIDTVSSFCSNEGPCNRSGTVKPYVPPTSKERQEIIDSWYEGYEWPDDD